MTSPRLLVLLSCVAAPLLAAEPAPGLLGFLPEHAAAQAGLETKFDAQLNPADLRGWLETMAAEPNHVGSPHDKLNAEFTLAKFQEWGWDAHIETFYVLYPTPLTQKLELVAPTTFTARIHEPEIAGDRTSGKTKDALPPYHAYGADGDVTAELVYVNRGMPDDYKELETHGVSVKGRIVIVRYGGGWRGLKPKLAYEHGAVGCLIYSDPADDGYGAGDVYPKGGYRPADGVQRGSVADMPVYPGDPLTPGIGATKDAKRLPLSEAKTVLKIPVMPISYADAQPMLAALAGSVVPPAWRGALPITYHIGPGPAKVHLAITSDWSLKPVYDVIATIKGRELPDQWVIRGNHRDGWVFGAWDPLSGHVAMMAEARSIGALVQSGWKPKRTLVYCSWDGEEPGLLGSTEWAETHADELQKKAVLYLNSDTNSRGFLQVAGSHALQSFVNQVAGSVRDPEMNVSVLARLRASLLVDGSKDGASAPERAIAKQLAAGQEVPIGALGSGSDFTPFLQHLGIGTLSIEFGGEDQQAGVYHSIYDSFDHYDRFGDPGYHYGIALAQTVGRVMLRMADADVLPVHETDFSDTVGRYLEEIHTLADNLRSSTEEKNRLIDANAYILASDPTETYVQPAKEGVVPFLNLAALDNAVLRLKQSAATCDRAGSQALAEGLKLTAAQRAEVETLLQGMEQALTDNTGLPGRDWFRHMIYAPGLLTGYGVKTLPGVREAIEGRRWAEAEKYSAITGHALDVYSDRLDRLSAILKPVPPKN
ncbi:transferrin receptor-like dimerization domain-containing protein [Opitutus sp. GAS368]|uniref:transferrin receptor-like dimerization domain-containing protein n=1 Tax=Opitutus sp. GAS368 TaxID=1882749 RepID=UPI00087B3FC6|nr:transferrin receptor-like dimerization domain-containing protein [Opitutus sp. GAS368]SDS55889.1 N-acetylated-alpha-linked acidic dipeptidase [Opitutus sp. GAS368]